MDVQCTNKAERVCRTAALRHQEQQKRRDATPDRTKDDTDDEEIPQLRVPSNPAEKRRFERYLDRKYGREASEVMEKAQRRRTHPLRNPPRAKQHVLPSSTPATKRDPLRNPPSEKQQVPSTAPATKRDSVRNPPRTRNNVLSSTAATKRDPTAVEFESRKAERTGGSAPKRQGESKGSSKREWSAMDSGSQEKGWSCIPCDFFLSVLKCIAHSQVQFCH